MSLPGKIEIVSNIATIGAAVLLSLVLVKVYFVPNPSSPARTAPPVRAAAEATVGTSLKSQLPGVDWSKNGRTLVLAISTACHFCKDSEPFYRRIRQEVGGGVKMVAVLPQPQAEAEQYLSTAGLKVDQVKQLTLNTIGVRGTPTMLLVDGKGVVTKVWVGRLQDQDQEQVLSVLKKG
jgi:hypothetical protein